MHILINAYIYHARHIYIYIYIYHARQARPPIGDVLIYLSIYIYIYIYMCVCVCTSAFQARAARKYTDEQ